MTLEEIIELVPEGFDWLIRNDETKGYMANVAEKALRNLDESAKRFVTYAPTVRGALMESIRQANEYVKEQPQ